MENYKLDLSSEDFVNEYTSMFDAPINHEFYSEPTVELVEKLKREVENDDSSLTLENRELIRNANVLNLKIFFIDSYLPIKELFQISASGKVRSRKSNYVSEKCPSRTIEFDKLDNFCGQIVRTLREELSLDCRFRTLNIKDEVTVDIRPNTTFSFLKTRYSVFERIILLNISTTMIQNEYILIDEDGVFIFFTPEYENSRFKRITVWYLSNDDKNIGETVKLVTERYNMNHIVNKYLNQKSSLSLNMT